MTNKTLTLAVLAATLVFVGAAAAQSDDNDPGRGVARISVISGDVSLQRGDTAEWTAAAVNAPMVVQDRLFTGANSRAEVQFDYSNMMRVAANAELRLSELENRRYGVQLARGLTTFRVLRNQEADVEISTASVAVRPLKKGIYRIAVLADGATQITVRSGEAEIFSPRGVEKLKSGRTMLVRGSASDPEFQMVSNIPEDDWDNWNERRDRDLERSSSYRYVSRDIYGAEDLDSHGRWVNVAPYGNVWTPYVSAGWAPYRAGRWAWVDYYGWTWVSYDPWGWAPYHYGRWFNQPGYGWCWWAGGGLSSRHYWRPALVGFFGWGGVGVGIGFGRVGWIPLAPYETYRPWYGRNYYRGHRNSTYIDNSVNIVNNVNIRNTYRNARVNNAVTAVDGTDFSRGRVTSIRTISDGDLNRASAVHGQVPVVPERDSLRLGDRAVSPRAADSGRQEGRFYSRRETKPVERVSFDEQRQGLEQVARRSATEEGPRRTNAAAAAERGPGWRSANEGSRQAESSSAPAGRASGNDGGGWRRFGEPSRNSAPEARTGENAPRESSARESDGWRRFGEPSRGASPDVRTGGSTSRENARESDGWRRLGESPRTGAEPMERRSESGSSRGSGARRESGGSFSVDPPAARGEERRSERRSETYEPRRSEQPRYERREAPVRISPPIVQERGSPRGDDGGFGRSRGGGGYEGPRGGGGAPAPSSGGDGGGRSGGDGGGRSGGDGGAGRSSGGAGRSSGGEGRGGGGGRIR